MNGQSVVIATPAFARTRCRRCGHYVRPGQAVVSRADGFRHLGCAMSH